MYEKEKQAEFRHIARARRWKPHDGHSMIAFKHKPHLFFSRKNYTFVAHIDSHLVKYWILKMDLFRRKIFASWPQH